MKISRWFYVVALLCTLPVHAATLDVRGETDFFVDQGQFYNDNLPVRIKIDPTLNGSTVSESFTFRAYTQNFTYEPGEATSLPDQYANGKRRAGFGHMHVYATFLGDNSNDPASEDFWNYTNVFLGAPAANEIDPGIFEFDITLPAEGPWQITTEIQYDDHTSRGRWHPQYYGSFDTVQVNVVPVPEPSAIIMMGSGLMLLVRRRRYDT